MIWILLGEEGRGDFMMFLSSARHMSTVDTSSLSPPCLGDAFSLHSGVLCRVRPQGRRLQEHSPHFRVCLFRQWFHILRQFTEAGEFHTFST